MGKRSGVLHRDGQLARLGSVGLTADHGRARAARCTAILALACLAGGCEEVAELPPVVFKAESSRHVDDLRSCVTRRHSDAAFADTPLEDVGLPRYSGDYVHRASDGTLLMIYSRIVHPNLIVVRSGKKLTPAQTGYLRACADDPR